MTTGINAGQVRGPIQMAFATSIDPVVPLEISITRMAVTTEKAEAQSGDNRTMGRKHIIPTACIAPMVSFRPSWQSEPDSRTRTWICSGAR